MTYCIVTSAGRESRRRVLAVAPTLESAYRAAESIPRQFWDSHDCDILRRLPCGTLRTIGISLDEVQPRNLPAASVASMASMATAPRLPALDFSHPLYIPTEESS